MSDYFVHESSYIGEGCTIGAGTKIWHFSHVMSSAVIGENCNIGQNVFIDRDVHIGNRCKIQNNVSVYNGVQLEDDVFKYRQTKQDIRCAHGQRGKQHFLRRTCRKND